MNLEGYYPPSSSSSLVIIILSVWVGRAFQIMAPLSTGRQRKLGRSSGRAPPMCQVYNLLLLLLFPFSSPSFLPFPCNTSFSRLKAHSKKKKSRTLRGKKITYAVYSLSLAEAITCNDPSKLIRPVNPQLRAVAGRLYLKPQVQGSTAHPSDLLHTRYPLKRTQRTPVALGMRCVELRQAQVLVLCPELHWEGHHTQSRMQSKANPVNNG